MIVIGARRGLSGWGKGEHLEDVDLIGTERRAQSIGANALLLELLNQMDGLTEDAGIMFLMTTNRPDHLEPALASRPGRI